MQYQFCISRGTYLFLFSIAFKLSAYLFAILLDAVKHLQLKGALSICTKKGDEDVKYHAPIFQEKAPVNIRNYS
jgi:hypothetical protein